MATRKVPSFRTEQEEAEWWDQNRTELDKELLAAGQAGKLWRLTQEQLAARVSGKTKLVSLRLAEEDLNRAREQAASKGLRYQTYLKSLLHEALRKSG